MADVRNKSTFRFVGGFGSLLGFVQFGKQVCILDGKSRLRRQCLG